MRMAVIRIIAAAKKVGKPVCVIVASAAEAGDFAGLGASAFIISSDQGQMRRAAAQTLTDFKTLVQTTDGSRRIAARIPAPRLPPLQSAPNPPPPISGRRVCEVLRNGAGGGPEGARTWYARGQNFIIAYSDAEKDAVLSRANQP